MRYPTWSDAATLAKDAFLHGRVFFDARVFGAFGDGVHDDTSAIQAAINSAEKNGGGTVYLPFGTYLISAPLEITADSITIHGANRHATRIVAAFAGNTIRIIGTAPATRKWDVLEDLELDGGGVGLFAIETNYANSGVVYRSMSIANYATGSYSDSNAVLVPLKYDVWIDGVHTGNLVPSGSGGGIESIYNVKDSGAVGDGVTDDASAIQAAINLADTNGGGIVYFPTGKYVITVPLVIPKGAVSPYNAPIEFRGTGQGNDGSSLMKTTATTSGLPDYLVPNVGPTTMDVDAYIIVQGHDNTYRHHVRISGIRFDNTQHPTAGSAYGIYAPACTRANFRNIRMRGGDLLHTFKAFYWTIDTHLSSFQDWEADFAVNGLVWAPGHTGTTITMINVFCNWIEDYAFDFDGLLYSDLIGCGADHVGQNTTTDHGAYRFNACHGITLQGCGTETVKGNVLTAIDSDGIVFTSFNAYYITGLSTGLRKGYLWNENSEVVFVGCLFNDFGVANASVAQRLIPGAGLTQFVFISTKQPTTGTISADNGTIRTVYDATSGWRTNEKLGGSNYAGLRSVRRQYFDVAAPVGGTWTWGDIVWNVQPVSAGKVGWICTAAGTPGTWKTFGTIT